MTSSRLRDQALFLPLALAACGPASVADTDSNSSTTTTAGTETGESGTSTESTDTDSPRRRGLPEEALEDAVAEGKNAEEAAE